MMHCGIYASDLHTRIFAATHDIHTFFFLDYVLPNPAFWLANERSVWDRTDHASFKHTHKEFWKYVLYRPFKLF